MLLGPALTGTDGPELQCVILPAPLGSPTGLGNCTAGGPGAILAALNRNGNSPTKDILSRVHQAPLLDFRKVDQAGAVVLVQRAVYSWRSRGRFVLLLGGEHTVTLGATRALQECGETFGVVYFDAHADLKSGIGSYRLTHATVARRLVEDGLGVAGLGWRSFDAREYEFWRRNDLEVCPCSDLTPDSDGFKRALDSLPEKVYLSLDVDVLDPAIMPATGAPEPDGISQETLLSLLRRIFDTRQVVGADLVELSPCPGKIGSVSTAACLGLSILEKALGQRTSGPAFPPLIPFPDPQWSESGSCGKSRPGVSLR